MQLDKFMFSGTHGKTRTGKEFYDFQKKHGRYHFAPIPIRGDRVTLKEQCNPVWNSIREINEYVRAIPGWHVCLDQAETYFRRRRGGFGGPPMTPEQKLTSGTDMKSVSRDWSWGFNTNDALALYDRGWHEGFEAVRAGMENAARAAMSKALPVEDLDKHVSGSIVDVPAYIRGEPEAMWEFQDQMKEVLHLEVEVDSFVVATTDADEYLHRGVAVMSAVMALRRMGVFVTLYQREVARTDIWTPKGEKGFQDVTATIHMMNQDLTENLSEVLLTLCHPGWHRKVYFQAVASAWGCTMGGLSYQGRNTDDFIPKPGSGKIVIPGHFHKTFGRDDDMGIDWGNTWASPKAAELMVEQMLKCAAHHTPK